MKSERTEAEADTGLVAVKIAGGVLSATLNRPAKRNALSRAVLAELKRVFSESAAIADLRLAVLGGAGDKTFAAGGDLRELDKVRSREDTRRWADESYEALEAIRAFPVPVIAALNGDALGGGAELALACDFRVAARHAHIGFVQGRLNISTAWGGGADLMRLVGPARALHLLATGARLDAAAAERIGLVDAVARADEPLGAAVDRFIAPLMERMPQVLRGFKALAAAVRAGLPADAIREVERRHLVETWTHPDHWRAAEGVLDARKGTKNESGS